MTSAHHDTSFAARQIWTAAWCATFLKIVCAVLTLGTVDITSFQEFGATILSEGMPALYQREPLFNHMPLVGGFSALLATIVGDQQRLFALLFRLPGIAADLVTVSVLLRHVPLTLPAVRWAMLLFAHSPVSFMVSGFHGNVDPILVCMLVLTTAACADGRLLASAVFYAVACNLKAPALLLGPAIFFFWIGRGAGTRFALAAGALTLLGWSYPLLACPQSFLRNVLGYSSYWGTWGITYWLWRSGLEQFEGIRHGNFTAAQAAVMQTLKWVIIAGTLFLSWWRRRVKGDQLFVTVAGVWLIFMALAPGGAAQYLVWPAPFLLLVSPRSYALVTAASTLHLGIFYTVLCGGLPWDYGIVRPDTDPNSWLLTSNLPWLAFTAVLCWHAPRLFSRADARK